MARLNIYLQDSLAASVKTADLNASEICQQALREALEAKGQGVGAKIESLRAALRLQRTTPKGHRAVGADEGARWAREAATVKELQDMDELVVEQLEAEAGEDPIYMVRWADDASGTQSYLDVGKEFETLGPWLLKNGSEDVAYQDLSGKGRDLGLDATEYLVGFVDAARRVWHELKPLVEQDQAVLRRQLVILSGMEHGMLASDILTASNPPGTTSQSAGEEANS